MCASLALMCMLAHGLHAQKAAELDYEIHFTGSIPSGGEKFILQGLSDQDPGIQVWIDRPTQSVLARTIVPLDFQQLREAIEPVGLEIGYAGSVPPQTIGGSPGYGAEQIPKYEDTGRPDIDGARYLSAKAAWFTMHPMHFTSPELK